MEGSANAGDWVADPAADEAYAALVTLLDFRQRAQTYTRRVRPPSSWIRTFCRFGLKRRRVATIEWLRELPKAGRLPQLWQTFAMDRGMVAGLAGRPTRVLEAEAEGWVLEHSLKFERFRADTD
jgi:hypothetical protein